MPAIDLRAALLSFLIGALATAPLDAQGPGRTRSRIRAPKAAVATLERMPRPAVQPPASTCCEPLHPVVEASAGNTASMPIFLTPARHEGSMKLAVRDAWPSDLLVSVAERQTGTPPGKTPPRARKVPTNK